MSNSFVYEEIAKEIEGIKEIVRESNSEIQIHFWDGKSLHIQSGINNLDLKIDRWQKRKFCTECGEEIKTEREINTCTCNDCDCDMEVEVAMEEVDLC